MNVFSYWEGPQPPYITDCLATIRRHAQRDCHYRHVTPENFSKMIPEGLLHPAWRSIRELGVKSDCVRVAMLAQHGGLYVDADTVMLRSPVGVIPEAADCAYMTWSRPPRRVIAGYLYCRPGSPVAQKWLENVNRFLAYGRTGWTDLGERCLTPALDEHAETSVEMPLDTFLPIEIDREVERFFTKEDFRPLVRLHTIAFGLNHSWMTARRPVEMRMRQENIRRSPLLIHRLMTESRIAMEKPFKITVCCVTYRRPHLLGKLIHSFENQTYQNRELLILDDSGELNEASGHQWRLISSPDRSPTLGAKRNRLAAMVSSDTHAIVPWDDDDLACPWALEAIAAGLNAGDWVRPSQALVLHQDGRTLLPIQTHSVADTSDKAFHPAWGYTVGAFRAVGGYPEDASLGEDLVLAKRLRDSGVTEADPMTFGFRPYYLFGPWNNEHFSYVHKDYATWPDRLPSAAGITVQPELHGLVLDPSHMQPGPALKRPFQHSWWGDDVR